MHHRYLISCEGIKVLTYSYSWPVVQPGNPYSGKGLVQLTSLHKVVLISYYVIHLSYKTSYLEEEVNCTEPSPSLRVPWCIPRLRVWVRWPVVQPGSTYLRGRLRTILLLVHASFNQLLYYSPFLQNKLPLWGGQLYWAFSSFRVPWCTQGQGFEKEY